MTLIYVSLSVNTPISLVSLPTETTYKIKLSNNTVYVVVMKSNSDYSNDNDIYDDIVVSEFMNGKLLYDIDIDIILT